MHSRVSTVNMVRGLGSGARDRFNRGRPILPQVRLHRHMGRTWDTLMGDSWYQARAAG